MSEDSHIEDGVCPRCEAIPRVCEHCQHACPGPGCTTCGDKPMLQGDSLCYACFRKWLAPPFRDSA